MTTSSSPNQRGRDAALIVYSLLIGHPASAVSSPVPRSPLAKPARPADGSSLLESDRSGKSSAVTSPLSG